jgi:hypothetical protein
MGSQYDGGMSGADWLSVRAYTTALRSDSLIWTLLADEEPHGVNHQLLPVISMGREGIEPSTLGLRGPCSAD